MGCFVFEGVFVVEPLSQPETRATDGLFEKKTTENCLPANVANKAHGCALIRGEIYTNTY